MDNSMFDLIAENWNSILQQLREDFSIKHAAFATWLKGLQPVRFEDGVLTVMTDEETSSVCSFIQQRYGAYIEAAVNNYLGGTQVKTVTIENAPQQDWKIRQTGPNEVELVCPAGAGSEAIKIAFEVTVPETAGSAQAALCGETFVSEFTALIGHRRNSTISLDPRDIQDALAGRAKGSFTRFAVPAVDDADVQALLDRIDIWLEPLNPQNVIISFCTRIGAAEAWRYATDLSERLGEQSEVLFMVAPSFEEDNSGSIAVWAM